jgi:membrane protease YdiL (CAAX protease family)
MMNIYKGIATTDGTGNATVASGSRAPAGKPRVTFFLVAAFEGSLAGLAWGLGWLLGQPPFEHFSWSRRDALLGLLASLPLLAAFVLMLLFPIGPFARIKHFCDKVIGPMFAGCTLPSLAGISGMAGIGEEMLFRGVLQPVFERSLGLWLALLATNLLFGLLHPITAMYIVVAALFGAYLGCLYWLSDNLLLVMVTHAVYDFVVLGYLVARSQRREPSGEGGTAQ